MTDDRAHTADGDTSAGADTHSDDRPVTPSFGTQELAGERTTLANERTLLAWYRTSFGVYALAVGVGSVVPSLTDSSPDLETGYATVGVLFALVGVAAAVDGLRRYRRLHSMLPQLMEVPGEASRLTAFGAAVAGLGVAVACLLIVDRFV